MVNERLIKTSMREIDIGDFTELYYHKLVQGMMGKTQLSFVDKEYLGGRHSRLEHSMIVFHFMDELTKHLKEKGKINNHDVRDLKAASLLHDLAHPPFSHALEFVLGSLMNEENPVSHNQKSVELIEKSESLQQAIDSCGADVASVKKLVGKEHRHSKLLSHKTLGIDKIAYTLLDAHHTGYRTPGLPFFLDLLPHYMYEQGELGIQEIKMEEIKDIQNIMQKMYTEVYLTPRVTKYKRVIQKAVEYLIARNRGMTPERVWGMGEGIVLHYLESSSNPTIKELTKRYNSRGMYRTAAAIKVKGFSEVRGKLDVPVVELKQSRLEPAVILAHNPVQVTRLEEEVVADLGMKQEDFLIAVSSDYQRMVPEDVALFNQDTRNQKTLFEQYDKHAESLKERARAAFAIHLITTPYYLQKIRGNAQNITEKILQAVNSNE